MIKYKILLIYIIDREMYEVKIDDNFFVVYNRLKLCKRIINIKNNIYR